MISAKDIHEKQRLTADTIQYSESLYYQINSNWDCMYTIVCNAKDIQDEDLIKLATGLIDKRHSLIITGNGGQGKTSLMMRLAVNFALSTKETSIIWVSMDIISSKHLENFWSMLETGKNYIICVDSPFYNEELLKKLKSTFPIQQKENVQIIFAERIQRIEELLEEEPLFTGWIEPITAICCIGNASEKKFFQILENYNITTHYYELKKDWKHAVIEKAVAVNYGENMAKISMDKIESQLPESINSIAEQVYHIFFIMNKTYPSISGINLDWKEWREHLRKWFHNMSIDEYYYEPIAACSVFSLDLDLDTYTEMMHLPEELWNKMNYMVGEHTEPVRYNRERNTIQPKHDVCADMFFYSHPKANLIRCLIQYLNVTKNTQAIFDNVLRKGKMCRNIVLAYGKKLDYQPLINHIKKIGFAPKNQSRLMLAGLWNCHSLQEQVCYIEKNLTGNKLEELTDYESKKVFAEIAIIYRNAKKYQLSEKMLWKALEIDENALPIYNELGRLYVQQNKFEEAEEIFRKALEIDENALPSYNELGRLYVQQNKFEEAEEIFRKALEIDENDLPSYNELGRLYVQQNKFEEAEEIFRKALEIDENALPSYNELGRLYVQQNKFEEAEEIFRKALEIDADALPIYNELGRLYVQQNKFEEAEEIFRKALEIDENDLPSYNELGRLYVQQNKFEEAEEIFRKALEMGNLPSYNELGRLYVQQNKFEEAEEIFRKALEMGNLPSYNELGRLYVQQNKFEEAEEIFRKALEIDADALPIYNELGRLYVQQNKFEEAEEIFRKALEIDADALPIYNELGRLYVQQNKFEEAEEIFRKALEIDADALPIYNELGRLYVQQNKFEEAEEIFQKALENILGDHSYILTSLINLYSKTNNSKKADELIKKYTNKTTAFYHTFCKRCYIYIKNEKGLKEAIKYKKHIQAFNKRFNI